jgi:hypothetical protein
MSRQAASARARRFVEATEPFAEERERSNAPTVCEAQVAAMDRQTDAWNRVAKALEGFAPAADTIHGLGERLDNLCGWLKGKWPWIIALAASMIVRTVNMAPDDVPKLVNAVAGVIKAAGG